jgi:hypothetical protein
MDAILVIDNWGRAMDKKLNVIAIFFDFASPKPST